MSLEEIKVIDKVEILENGIVQVREATRIIKDGQQIAETYHRASFEKGADLSSMPANVRAIAAAAWAG
jgi:hypothetical protein